LQLQCCRSKYAHSRFPEHDRETIPPACAQELGVEEPTMMPLSPLMTAVFHLSRARLGGWHAPMSLLLALATTLYIVVPTLAGEGQTTGFCKGTGQKGGKFFCDDFSSGTAEQWEPQVGVWTVEDGEYVGEGTFNPTCFGISNDELNRTLIRNLEASNVDVRVDIRSIERVDKGIILRSTGPDNQIELNFHTQGHASQGDHSLRYAAIYARVSTEDQGKGFSIPTQIEACHKLADREGYTVIESHLSKPFGLGSS
jgi:Resolvase, N terminal domain